MIKITVRYSTEQSAAAASKHAHQSTSSANQSTQRTSGSHATNVKRSKMNNFSTQDRSMVEIKYRREVSGGGTQKSTPSAKVVSRRAPAHQVPPLAKVPVRAPRGSLSSCSSSSPDLSGTEDYYCGYLDNDDDDDECDTSASVFDDAPSKLDLNNNNYQLSNKTDAASEPAGQRATASIRNMRANNKNNLHARSISLIVNPNFGEPQPAATPAVRENAETQPAELEADDELADELFSGGSSRIKRRNSIMGHQRLRRPQSTEKPQVVTARLVVDSSESQVPVVAKQSCQVERHQAANDAKRPTETSEDKRMRLREIGLALRQISEEFARNRRLTV